MPQIAYHIRVTGHVQGVAYRAWAQAEAERLGLRGWVRNRGDGSVEATVAGPKEAVEAMVLAMREGPGAARVTDVWTDAVAPGSVPGDGFRITG